MTLKKSLICTSAIDPEVGRFDPTSDKRRGTGGSGPFAAVKTGGIIDWWITDKPQGLVILI